MPRAGPFPHPLSIRALVGSRFGLEVEIMVPFDRQVLGIVTTEDADLHGSAGLHIAQRVLAKDQAVVDAEDRDAPVRLVAFLRQAVVEDRVSLQNVAMRPFRRRRHRGRERRFARSLRSYSPGRGYRCRRTRWKPRGRGCRGARFSRKARVSRSRKRMFPDQNCASSGFAGRCSHGNRCRDADRSQGSSARWQSSIVTS